MKALKYTFCGIYIILCLLVTALCVLLYYYSNSIDNNYKITKGNGFNIETRLPVTTEYQGVRVGESNEINVVGSTLKVDVKLLGVIPIKTTTLEVVEETYVAVLGSPFGIKIFTDGVLVIDMESVETTRGNENPAVDAGIKTGDYIISIDGNKVYTNEDVAQYVEDSNGAELNFTIKRDGIFKTVILTPAFSNADGRYKAGLWVKDSTAGLGTLTFYSPYNDMLCGLGHAMYESNTGTVLNFRRGELVGAQIKSVVRGTSGIPGELKGTLTYNSLGSLYENCLSGVYGSATCIIDTENLTQIAHKQEIIDGPATIICTVDGDGPKSFSCEINIGNFSVNDTIQNMTVTITDPKLLDITGGIVQGMSGSPILQNGKLVGALTHVLIDNPTKGYGIFAENMLETAQSVAEEQLKEAS